MNTAKDAAALVTRLKTGGKSKAGIIQELSACCRDWPYVFGAAGEMCTPENRRKYAGYRQDHAAKIKGACPVLSGKQSSCEGCKWNGCRIFDCRGFTRWLLAMVGLCLYGGTVTAQWETSSNWVAKGDIKDMPRSLVCCIFREGHTGMHVADNLTRHCSTYVKEEPLPGRPNWLRYGIPAGLYSIDELRKAGVTVDETKNIPTIRKGAEGDAVEELQAILNAKYGFSLEVDGKFGKATETAVKAFQSAHGLYTDGVVGKQTWIALGVTPGNTQKAENRKEETPLATETGGIAPDSSDDLISLPRLKLKEMQATLSDYLSIINQALEGKYNGNE